MFKVSSRSGNPVERMRQQMADLAAAEGHAVEHWQPHDYRRTGTTHLAGMLDADDNPLVRPDVPERLLAHEETGVSGLMPCVFWMCRFNVFCFLPQTRQTR